MDIALIEPATGLIQNVIVAESIDAAKAHFPDLLCIERGDLPLEPGGTYNYISGEVTRAPVSPEHAQDAAVEMAAKVAAIELQPGLWQKFVTWAKGG